MPDAAETIARVPLFAGLNQRQRRRLARKFKERSFEAGAAVVREGQMSGIGFFVIAAGEATVRAGGTELGRLGPGDHFGELALIGQRERAASVIAETPLTCLELPMWDFREFVTSDGEVSWRLLQHVVSLLPAADGG